MLCGKHTRSISHKQVYQFNLFIILQTWQYEEPFLLLSEVGNMFFRDSCCNQHVGDFIAYLLNQKWKNITHNCQDIL